MLWAVYMDSLLQDLAVLGGSTALAFADDLVIISQALPSARVAIQTVYDWAARNSIQVN